MAAPIEVTPDSVQKALDRAEPGQTIQLKPGRYTRPLRLCGKVGDEHAPITIRGGRGVVLDGCTPFALFTNRANLVARADWLRGRRPAGIQAIASEAFLTIDSSDHVHVEDLSFQGAWPTAVLIDTSQSVRLRDIRIKESSFAFFLFGERTSDIEISHCWWLQDISRGDIWRRIPWKYIHGDDFTDADARGFDGDFLRSYRIRGRLHVHHNRIEHCFNGIHCFNRRDFTDDTLNSDVVIHDNEFRYVRDNAIEPEIEAHNWWIFRNRIFNCHAPFSLDMRKSSHFFIYDNLYWFDEQQGAQDDENRGGCFLKLGKKPPQVTEVSHYFFNNSLFLRSPLIKNGTFGGLMVANNLIGYASALGIPVPDCETVSTFLGDIDGAEVEDRFTTDWKRQKIVFDNNCIRHEHVANRLDWAGYRLTGTTRDLTYANALYGNLQATTSAVPKPLELALRTGTTVTAAPSRMGACRPGDPATVPLTPDEMLNLTPAQTPIP